MARRNRKKTQMTSLFPVQVAVAVAVVAGLALFYVYLNSQSEELGRAIKKLEVKRDQLRAKIVKEQCEWARLQAPANLERGLKDHGLAMTWPTRDQVVRVRADGSIDNVIGSLGRPPARVARVDRIVMND